MKSEGANLWGANLWGADLWGANLRKADLWEVKTPTINDHYFISEILFRAATEENQKDFAARIRFELNLCWGNFAVMAKTRNLTDWCIKILSKWDEFKPLLEKYK